MGQKSNPIGLRLGINKTSDSIWFDERKFSDELDDMVQIEEVLVKLEPNPRPEGFVPLTIENVSFLNDQVLENNKSRLRFVLCNKNISVHS